MIISKEQLENMSLIELKALAFDEFQLLEKSKLNLNILLEFIKRKESLNDRDKML